MFGFYSWAALLRRGLRGLTVQTVQTMAAGSRPEVRQREGRGRRFSTNMCLGRGREARCNRVTTQSRRALGVRQGGGRSNGAEAGWRTERSRAMNGAVMEPADREEREVAEVSLGGGPR